MKSSQELLDYVEKSGYRTRYGSDGESALEDITYALSLGVNCAKAHCVCWLNWDDVVNKEDVQYQKAIKEIYEFLIGEMK